MLSRRVIPFIISIPREKLFVPIFIIAVTRLLIFMDIGIKLRKEINPKKINGTQRKRNHCSNDCLTIEGCRFYCDTG